jgi:beta-N-acetylhexosaminidase
MKKIYRTYAFVGMLAGVATLLGYLYFNRPEPVELPTNATPGNQASSPSAVQNSAESTHSLTTSQKIAQLIAVPLDLDAETASISAKVAWTEQFFPGFVSIFGTDISSQQAEAAVTRLDEVYVEYPVGVSVAVDHEGGTVQRLSGVGFTRLPSWQQSCAAQSGTRTDVFGKSSLELAAVGIDVVFAPVVDVATSGGSLRTRACGDPEAIYTTATEYITAMRAAKIEPVLKHFPGIGSVRVDTHTAFSRLTPSLLESKIFTTLLEQFPALSVMTAHVGLSTQDPELPCTLSSDCIGAIQTNFPDSLVFSDALEMKAAVYRPAPLPEKLLAQVAREAVMAGVDVLVFGPEVSSVELKKVHAFLLLEYQDSPEFESAVEERLKKVLRYKELAGFVK